MKHAILTLFASKRFIIATATAAVDIALVFGFNIDPEVVKLLLTYINGLAMALIGGISLSDHGTGMGQPAGVDHKGRVVEPVVLPAD